VVIGNGNVAMDVARMLALTDHELRQTDTADHAIEALDRKQIREIVVLGRRGPAQAAFTNPEIKELGELADADIAVVPDEVRLDELSRAALERTPDRATSKKVEILQGFAQRPASGKSRRLTLRFLVSPTALIDDGTGGVGTMRLVRNTLYATATGTLQPKATDVTEELRAGLVFRSVGYRGVPLPGVPFNESWGVILNEKGRVLDAQAKTPVRGEYTAGWIKRGPSGVIGTNKPDAAETVVCMMDDLAEGLMLNPEHPEAAAADRFLRERQPRCVSYEDWQRLNDIEVERGRAHGRPRVKFTRIEDMLAALGRA